MRDGLIERVHINTEKWMNNAAHAKSHAAGQK
jgi:hypothetical protein